MDFDVNILGALLMVAMFFLGRMSGIASEASDWVDSAIKKEPIIKKGEIFKVEHIGGE